MASGTYLLKRSYNTGVEPTAPALSAGELGINTADGIIFAKKNINGVETIVKFLNSQDTPYTFLKELSSINFAIDNNQVSGIFSSVLGGFENNVSGAGSTILNGEGGKIHGDFSLIGTGLNNRIATGSDFSAIVGGSNNLISHDNSFTLGSNLSSHASNFTYVNNISATGYLYGDGSRLTGITAEPGAGSSTTTSIVTENFNATTSINYLVDTSSSSITCTLPANPAIGDTFYFQDPFLTWNINNFILNRNGNMIQGLSENFVCDLKGIYFNMTYIGSNIGWRIN